jgi:hypothetical protein
MNKQSHQFQAFNNKLKQSQQQKTNNYSQGVNSSGVGTVGPRNQRHMAGGLNNMHGL